MYFAEAVKKAEQLGYKTRQNHKRLQDGVYPFSYQEKIYSDGRAEIEITDAEGSIVATMK